MEKTTRTSKKQRELLAFIDGFIKSNDYGPSYREIMRALGYKSVSTVAVHIDGLIAKGYLRKKDNSARSIEIVSLTAAPVPVSDQYEQWLVARMRSALEKDAENHRFFEATLRALEIDPAQIRPTEEMTKA